MAPLQQSAAGHERVVHPLPLAMHDLSDALDEGLRAAALMRDLDRARASLRSVAKAVEPLSMTPLA